MQSELFGLVEADTAARAVVGLSAGRLDLRVGREVDFEPVAPGVLLTAVLTHVRFLSAVP